MWNNKTKLSCHGSCYLNLSNHIPDSSGSSSSNTTSSSSSASSSIHGGQNQGGEAARVIRGSYWSTWSRQTHVSSRVQCDTRTEANLRGICAQGADVLHSRTDEVAGLCVLKHVLALYQWYISRRSPMHSSGLSLKPKHKSKTCCRGVASRFFKFLDCKGWKCRI